MGPGETINPIIIIIGIVFALGIFISIMVLLRHFFCWYWKINEGIEVLRNIATNLITITDTLLESQNKK